MAIICCFRLLWWRISFDAVEKAREMLGRALAIASTRVQGLSRLVARLLLSVATGNVAFGCACSVISLFEDLVAACALFAIGCRAVVWLEIICAISAAGEF
jgi:hypothetical protein